MKKKPILSKVLEVIRTSTIPPTLREIMDRTDISSVSVASYYLDRLEALGFIERMPRIARGIVLKDAAPVNGTGAAGDGEGLETLASDCNTKENKAMDTMVRVYKKAPDPRIARRAVILQELRTPERLTDEQIQALCKEVVEIQISLENNPAEVEDE